jgi:hypothetical protein
MRESKRILLWCMALSLVLIGADLTFAATTGKISGTVRDARGQPLPGANVVVKGMRLGATTDAEGIYFILTVPPGVHTLTASLVGYGTISQTDVKVAVDLTTTVDFALEETALQATELIVIAQRPPVEPDKTTSKYILGSEDIESLPIIRSVSGLVALQPGVLPEGNDMIRGTSAADVTYYVDGIPIVTTDGVGAFDRFQFQNTSAVQELTVLTGGWEAEYGNAQAGIINLVTREAGENYSGRLEYKFDTSDKKHWGNNVYDAPQFRDELKWGDAAWENETDPEAGQNIHQRIDYTGAAGHFIEANLSGPLTLDAGLFVSTRVDRSSSSFPSSSSHTPGNTRNTVKLNYNMSDNVKIKLGGFYHWGKGWNNGISLDRSATAGAIRGLGDGGRNIFLPEGSSAGRFTDSESLIYASLTHTLSPKTFYEAKISRSFSKQDTSDIPAATQPLRRDAAGYFNLSRDVRAYEISARARYNVKFDISSQITRGHLVKAGVELTYSDAWAFGEIGENESRRVVAFYSKDGAPDGNFQRGINPFQWGLYLQDKMEFSGMIVNAGVRLDGFHNEEKGSAVPPFETSPMYNKLRHFRNAPRADADAKIAFSPRLGVSHPITAASTIRFFYGRFYKFPNLWTMNRQIWVGSFPDIDINGNGQIDPEERYNDLGKENQIGVGNIATPPEKTTSFEVGTDWNVISDYTLSLTAYYKTVDNQLSTGTTGGETTIWQDPGTGRTEQIRVNLSIMYEDIKGIELGFQKRFSNNFAFQTSFNAQWLSGGRAGGAGDRFFPDSTWVAAGNYWLGYENRNGQEVPIPLTQDEIREIGSTANQLLRDIRAGGGPSKGQAGPNEHFLAAIEKEPGIWAITPILSELNIGGIRGRDRTAFGSVAFLYRTPSNWGPKVGEAGLFGNIQANMIYRMQTGSRFEYSLPEGGVEERNEPLRTWIDLNAQKTFYGLRDRFDVTLFVETYNLFNQKDRRANNFDYIQWGLRKPRPTDQRYKDFGDPNDRAFLGFPRQVHLGLRLSF